MKQPRRTRDPPRRGAPGSEPRPRALRESRPRAVARIAVVLASAPWILPGCGDEGSRVDPLRIPWNQIHVPAAGARLSSASGAGTPVARETEGERGDAAALRRELRALHSPIEPGDGGYPSATVNACRNSHCHADLSPGAEIHSRIAAAACTRCHLPEGVPEEHRFCMVDADGGVCSTCHVPYQGTGASHAPFRELRCLACHNPHRSVETKLLPDPDGSRVCAQCHERTGELVAHGPYAEGKCLSCHAAHESAFAGLTRSSSADLCLGCHDREIEVPGRERPLPDMAALLCKARFAHGPIRAGDCSPCHNAHAALHANLLREPYPQDFYQIWDASHYALCFRCHPGELAAEARTTTKTGFRDGNRNLHYLHVNREKGRSCRTCHEVHASDLPFHLRASLPFGGWEMPIVYEQRPHGGACKAGCHQEEAYDRTRVPAPGELVRPGEG